MVNSYLSAFMEKKLKPMIIDSWKEVKADVSDWRRHWNAASNETELVEGHSSSSCIENASLNC
jgi:hypothetical protein